MLTNEEKKLLRKFNRKYSNEAACFGYLRTLLQENGLLKCHRCASPQVEHLEMRTVQCVDCSYESWFISDTFLARTRKLRAFFLLLWFQQHGYPISSSRAPEFVDISQSSASVMLKKIDRALLPDLEEQPNKVVISDELFLAVFYKRSRETPAQQHPRAEVQTFNRKEEEDASPSANGRVVETQNEELRTADSQLQSISSTTAVADPVHQNRQTILNVLNLQADAVCIEQLAELTSIAVADLHLQLLYLEFENLIQQENGGRFKIIRSRLALSRAASESVSKEDLEKGVEKFVSFCHLHFHGISRKYLQLYISQYMRVAGQIRFSWDTIMCKLLKYGPIAYEDILHYSSPQSVCFSL